MASHSLAQIFVAVTQCKKEKSKQTTSADRERENVKILRISEICIAMKWSGLEERFGSSKQAGFIAVG